MNLLRSKSTIFTIVATILCSIAAAQPFAVGHTTLNVTDPSRNRPVTMEIYYPADVVGNDVAFTQQPITAPIVTFGHGFVMTWDAYANVWEELVANGYVVAFPITETGFSPNHLELGKDLAFVVTAMQTESTTPASRFFGRLDSSACVMGHSMGGGAAFLAVQYNPSIRTMITLAAAETSTSAIGAAASITIPSLVIAGANDCVTPPSAHQLPMYAALVSSCKTYISIIGASHCQMADQNTLCSIGEASCTPTPGITRSNQHTIINRYLVPWLDYHLKNDCIAGNIFAATVASDAAVTYQLSCTICPSTGLFPASSMEEIKIYPNPTSGALQLQFSAYFNGNVTVLDIYGKSLKEFKIKDATEVAFSISDLPEGYYVLRISDHRNLTQFRSLIKSH